MYKGKAGSFKVQTNVLTTGIEPFHGDVNGAVVEISGETRSSCFLTHSLSMWLLLRWLLLLHSAVGAMDIGAVDHRCLIQWYSFSRTQKRAVKSPLGEIL